jgi:hypothetical protein
MTAISSKDKGLTADDAPKGYWVGRGPASAIGMHQTTRKNAMRNLGEWFIGLSLSFIVASEVGSADPVIAAQKRAARGMLLSLVSSAVFCGVALAIAPDGVTANGLAAAAAIIQQRVAAGFGLAALASSAVGMYFILRYVLVLKYAGRSRRRLTSGKSTRIQDI